jgi:LysR family hydrogen peroxide-inducible transcriptional activator
VEDRGPQTIQCMCKMYEGPEFRHLRYFVAVAEECNFCKAAQRLHVSQPSLSSQIRHLEDGLGAPLLVRSHAGTSLTPAGHEFLSHAKQMLLMRDRAVENTSTVHSGAEMPFRFGYCPFVNHELVHETILGYREMVPKGIIEPSSDCSGPLSTMVAEGRLDAALVTYPIAEKHQLFVQPVCSEELLVCLRADDPLAQGRSIPRAEVAKRLKIFINRVYHPLLYDELIQKFSKAGIHLHPSDFVSALAEMQFLVKENIGFGLIQERVPLDPELTTRRIEGFPLRIKTGFVCYPAQQRPVFPLLAFRIANLCAKTDRMPGKKKPNGRVPDATLGQLPMFG